MKKPKRKAPAIHFDRRQFEPRWVYHDGGKSLSSLYGNDDNCCMVCAIAIATGMTFDTIYLHLEERGRKPNNGSEPNAYVPFLNDLGSRYKGMSGVPLKEFLRINHYGIWVIRVEGHALAALQGIVMDAFEPDWSQPVEEAWRLDYPALGIAKQLLRVAQSAQFCLAHADTQLAFLATELGKANRHLVEWMPYY